MRGFRQDNSSDCRPITAMLFSSNANATLKSVAGVFTKRELRLSAQFAVPCLVVSLLGTTSSVVVHVNGYW